MAAAPRTRYAPRPMHDIFSLLIPLALAAVSVTLAVGIYSLFRGGDFARSWSNKLMRLRVLMQFCAILILIAAVVLRHRMHG
jgi:uncharacterized membrane protein